MIKWVASLLFFNVFVSNGQFNEKITLQYGTEKGLHARAMEISGNDIFIGTNTGQLFKINILDKKIDSFERRGFREFRDLVILPNKIIVLSSGDTSALLIYNRTTMEVERVQMFNSIFLDGLAYEAGRIFAMGDPIFDHFTLFEADTSSLFFIPIPSPVAQKGEASYAASGSTAWRINGQNIFVSGGESNKLFLAKDSTWIEYPLPFSPCPTCGAYSADLSGKTWYVAGGNYLEPHKGMDNFYFSKNRGKTWKSSKNNPTGYRSTIVAKGKILAAGGTNGLDISLNKGKSWMKISDKNYMKLQFTNSHLIASLTEGKVEMYELLLWRK